MGPDKPTDWPPPCPLRENPRDRQVILLVRPDVGVVVWVPNAFDRAELPRVFEPHRPRTQKRDRHAGRPRENPIPRDLS